MQADGGDIEFRGWDPSTGVVRLKMAGACASCPSSTVTARFMVCCRFGHLRSTLDEAAIPHVDVVQIKNLLCHYLPDDVKDVERVEDDDDSLDGEHSLFMH